MSSLELSVVVPVFNEAQNISRLLQEIASALDALLRYEIIVIDDHSTDQSLTILRRLKPFFPQLRILHHRTQCGQSTAIFHGVQWAKAPWIATLDGDGQNDPQDIRKILHVQQGSSQEIKLFAGWRVQRRDKPSKRWASRWANAVRSYLLQDQTPDTGCGIKLFERQAFLQLPYFDHMHRYLPALMQRAGWKSMSVPVNHRQRTSGVSKYNNWQRAMVGIRDLLGVAWLIARHRLTQVEEQ